MSNQDYTSTFERACAYPFVSPDMFAHSSRVNIDTGFVETFISDVLIDTAPFAQQLTSSNVNLPGYDLTFTDGSALKDRIAVIAIGSNSSPDVLISKFRERHIGGTFLMIQGTIHHVAAAHIAAIGVEGTIPTTFVPHKGSSTHITVSFLSAAQADRLTLSEENYDVVKLHTPIFTRGISNQPVISNGAICYVSPWRSLSLDGVNPLVQAAIPTSTSLQKMSSIEAATLIAQRLAPSLDVREFFDTMALDVTSRLIQDYKLQRGAIPPSISGTQVIPAKIGIEAEKRGWPVPALEYLT